MHWIDQKERLWWDPNMWNHLSTCWRESLTLSRRRRQYPFRARSGNTLARARFRSRFSKNKSQKIDNQFMRWTKQYGSCGSFVSTFWHFKRLRLPQQAFDWRKVKKQRFLWHICDWYGLNTKFLKTRKKLKNRRFLTYTSTLSNSTDFSFL